MPGARDLLTDPVGNAEAAGPKDSEFVTDLKHKRQVTQWRHGRALK